MRDTVPSGLLAAAARALDARGETAALRALARAAARALGAAGATLRIGDDEARAPAGAGRARGAAADRALVFRGGRLTLHRAPPRPAGDPAARFARDALALAAAGWRRARRAADRDPLTGLPNRAALRVALARAWSEAERHGAPLAVAVADADGFKAWNDRYGHAAGDRALRRIARALRRGCRASDVVARWGGDEFALVLPRTDRAGADALALRLAAAARRPPLTIGVADRAGSAARGPAALLGAADADLRRAKRAKGAARGRTG